MSEALLYISKGTFVGTFRFERIAVIGDLNSAAVVTGLYVYINLSWTGSSPETVFY